MNKSLKEIDLLIEEFSQMTSEEKKEAIRRYSLLNESHKATDNSVILKEEDLRGCSVWMGNGKSLPYDEYKKKYGSLL